MDFEANNSLLLGDSSIGFIDWLIISSLFPSQLTLSRLRVLSLSLSNMSKSMSSTLAILWLFSFSKSHKNICEGWLTQLYFDFLFLLFRNNVKWYNNNPFALNLRAQSMFDTQFGTVMYIWDVQSTAVKRVCFNILSFVCFCTQTYLFLEHRSLHLYPDTLRPATAFEHSQNRQSFAIQNGNPSCVSPQWRKNLIIE